jgi:deoxyguanosine kinase
MFVAIEGCIATGKTTLAMFLASHYKGRSLLEETEKHPFIKDFYLDPQDYAFQTEMNFVLIHYHQLQQAKKDSLFNSLVFSDFLFDKDLIFASLTLRHSEEQRLFRLTYDFLKKRVSPPNLLICLKAPTKFLYERIQARGRQFEAPISFDYLDKLNQKYDEFFDRYKESQKIVLDATRLDSANREGLWTTEVREILTPFFDNLINVADKNQVRTTPNQRLGLPHLDSPITAH